jgi:hypothetical protein
MDGGLLGVDGADVDVAAVAALDDAGIEQAELAAGGIGAGDAGEALLVGAAVGEFCIFLGDVHH